ncbi:MAG: class I tRNA ligase family protein, partial [Planctomycetes bacterium]|nr:class I tRNA ligase family protein [Planctomycetota bacterium]
MYGKISTKPNYPELEHRILQFWEQNKVFDRLREKNRSGPPFKFLDGPITANNPMGVHHAWGRTLKDVFQRYRAMTGHAMRYQNGFDCQGLWVEVEVEKELGFRSKRDIEAFGIAGFVEKCKARVRKYSEIQTQQSVRLGYWMDWKNSYFTMSDENNYTIWHFLKKCHERGWIYRGEDVMPWCARCGTGISQQEMHEGYKRIADRAVFVRFRRKGVAGEEYLLVWTTTPWTLTSNVAAAVNPDLSYVKVRHRGAVYYLAEEALRARRKEEEYQRGEWVEGVPALESPADILSKAGGFETVGTVRGSEMVGWAYEGPFDDLPAPSRPGGFPRPNPALEPASAASCHRVIPWEAVGAAEGTGIVHIAPGCGKEDWDLGKAHGLVAVAPLREDGTYLEGFDWLTGRSATDRQTTEKILADLEARGVLVAVEDYPHSYPHCWRCASPLVFRQVDEWFIQMDELRLQIMEVAKKIRWMPEFGLEQELDWLRNMRDWMITKKRYWGLALPIYPCEACGHFDVIGSREELKARAAEGWEAFEGHSPHRPWVDAVKVVCTRCGKPVSRIPDVGNPWLDAGIVPFSTTGYLTDRAHWERWYPFDFITECFPGQFRNWFYSLLAMSTVLENREPFRCVLGHALVHDENGHEMHKSMGNVIWFDEAAEKMGVDVMRWMFVKQNPFQNLNFGYAAGETVRKRLLTLWNLCSFFATYANLDEPDLGDPPSPREVLSLMDRWVLSRLQPLVHTAHRSYREYDLA